MPSRFQLSDQAAGPVAEGRGAGEADSCEAIRLNNIAAAVGGFDPLALPRKNRLRPGAGPIT
jgi:hypothetical protein